MDFLGQQRCELLLAWYDLHGRTLPWRMDKPDPYRTWLSEIMLQQTTVVTVTPYFNAFTKRWPSVRDLATADLDQVLHAWQGLGYYARARNLHACAKTVTEAHGGIFPGDEKQLLDLPGIGPYTAAAITAIAFNRQAAPVDGNIERVFSRLMRLEKPSPGLRKEVATALQGIVPSNRPGDFVQALMDLGARVCTPRKPKCNECPWSDARSGGCLAFKAGMPEAYPVKKPKKKKPTRHGVAFWTETGTGQIYLRRREERGLLGGMMEIPSTDWREQSWQGQDAVGAAPFKADWRQLPGVVKHTFTHFHLELTVCIGQVADAKSKTSREGDVWCFRSAISDHALPTVMKKIVKHTENAYKKCDCPKLGAV